MRAAKIRKGSGGVAAWMALAGPVIALQSHAAEIFASVSVDGAVRYSTQPIDASYRLILREHQTQGSAAPDATSPSGSPPVGSSIQSLLDAAAQRHGVSATLVSAVAAVESGSAPRAVSSKGARGVMQLMPATAARYGVQGRQSLEDPGRNIDAGVRHLKDLLAQHQGNVALALAAYNAGSGAVSRHGDRIPPYRETMLYVPAVLAKSGTLSTP